jgi:glycosyltransferase involved in cell wall biosynthesis
MSTPAPSPSPAASLLVSVIVPCYKMGRFLAAALDSVGKQTYPHWEVIVVDDAGPEDGTDEIVEVFAKANLRHRVIFTRHAKNLGVGSARNTGITAAKGRMIALLDPDDLWLPGHLQTQVEVLLKHPEVTVASSPAWLFSDNPDVRLPVPEYFCDWERQIFPYSLALRNGFPTSSVVLHKDRSPILFTFDTSLHGTEDWDLWFRLMSAGAKFHLGEEPTILYRKHPAAVTNHGDKLRIQLQGLSRKHGIKLFEYQWVASLSLTHIVRMHEEQIRTLTARINQPGFLSRVKRKLRGLLHP